MHYGLLPKWLSAFFPRVPYYNYGTEYPKRPILGSEGPDALNPKP